MKAFFKLLTFLMAIVILSGCGYKNVNRCREKTCQSTEQQAKTSKPSCKNTLECEEMYGDKKQKEIYPLIKAEDEATRLMYFSAIGEGIAPQRTVSPAQAQTLAKRAALADAYRQLASKLYGIKVNARDSVKDAMLKSSTITTYVNGLIKNANIIDESFENGLYKVELELKIDKYKWNDQFSY